MAHYQWSPRKLLREKIFDKSGPVGLREYLAHELGDILTGPWDERVSISA